MDARFNDFTPGELASTEASAGYLVRLQEIHAILSPEVLAELAKLADMVQAARLAWRDKQGFQRF
jgi:hypothetical protein